MDNILAILTILAYEFKQDIERLKSVVMNIKDTEEKQVIKGTIDTKLYIYNSLIQLYFNVSGMDPSVDVRITVLNNDDGDYIYNQLMKDLNLNVFFQKLSLSNIPYVTVYTHVLFNMHMTSSIRLLLYYVKSIKRYNSSKIPNSQTTNIIQRSLTIEELSTFDGKNGKPSYVAVNGTVYDVTAIPSWQGGTHFQLMAGRDLTSQFDSCHGNISTLKNVPVVGTLSR